MKKLRLAGHSGGNMNLAAPAANIRDMHSGQKYPGYRRQGTGKTQDTAPSPAAGNGARERGIPSVVEIHAYVDPITGTWSSYSGRRSMHHTVGGGSAGHSHTLSLQQHRLLLASCLCIYCGHRHAQYRASLKSGNVGTDILVYVAP